MPPVTSHPKSPRRRLLTAGAIAVALAVPALPAAAAPGSTRHQHSAAAAAAAARARVADGWLARQLVDGSHFESSFGDQTFPDQGLTIDAILAFSAGKVADRRGRAALAWLIQPDILAGYVGDGTDESYSGAHGKAALALQVRGANPRNVSGRDLIAELRALQAPSGRLIDKSAFGDFSNAFGQSLGVVALKRAGAPSSAAARYLAGQVCPDGGVPIQCAQTTCSSSVDATAIAVQAFHATGRETAARRAVAWLAGQQNADGGFGSGSTNANSTGLAAAALAIEDREPAARRAVRALTRLQQGCTAPVADRGAIAFDATGFDPATSTRATTQAVLGLAGADLSTLTAAGSGRRIPVLSCPAAAR